MTTERLGSTAQALVADGRGILAADESTPTITKRFDNIGIEPTEDNRRAYRETLFNTPGLGEFISGAPSDASWRMVSSNKIAPLI